MMHNGKYIKFNRAFTLIELLVVVSIISMLSSIVFSGVASARAGAQVKAGLAFAANNYHAMGATDAVSLIMFNESSGNPLDLSINGYGLSADDLSAVVRSPLSPSGSGNSARLVSGDYFLQTNVISPDINYPNLTISAWVNLESIPSSDGVIVALVNDIGAPGGQEPLTMYYSDTNGITCFSNNFLVPGFEVSAGVLDINKWYHVACSLNRSSGELALYLYGKKVAKAVSTVGVQHTFDHIMVGNDRGWQISGGVGSDIDAYIDDVAVYGRSIN